MLHWVHTLGKAVLSCPGSPAVSVVVVVCLPTRLWPASFPINGHAVLATQAVLRVLWPGPWAGNPPEGCLPLLPGESFSRSTLMIGLSLWLLLSFAASLMSLSWGPVRHVSTLCSVLVLCYV